jgi:peptidyl-dipeptidase A
MNRTEEEAQRFIDEHVERVRPLLRSSSLASWHAATTGSDEAIGESARARTAVKKVYSEREGLERVRSLLQSGAIGEPNLRRQLVVLDQAYTANQLDPETIEDLSYRESELEGIFYKFRAKLDGEDLTDNELRDVLRSEIDNSRRRRAWEASKEIGEALAPKLLELVRRRNAAARKLGFPNFYSMELALQEIGEDELFTLLEDFAARSDDPFREMRSRIDSELAGRYAIAIDQVRPWHWEDFFGQEAPRIGSLDLDPFFEQLDFEGFARSYFSDVGMPVDDVLARSDLYEREGKDQHAFAMDVDREGDVRILCNLRNNEKWMTTLLHELGHAVYDKFLPRELPFLLRMPAHTLSTEAVAMFFGRLTRDPQWLRSRVGADLSPQLELEVRDQRRISMLVATRWMLVMAFFERELYANPERPDLGSYWWDLVERFQLIRRPEGREAPDWATKIHLSIAPVYYHNYLLGEFMASQLTSALSDPEDHSPRLGAFFRDRIFAKGANLPWNDLVRSATGESLSSSYFVEQFLEAAHGR